MTKKRLVRLDILEYNKNAMATTSNILTLLRYYASKQKSPSIDYGEFLDYVRRYAQHHLAENPDLALYTTGPAAISDELKKFADDRQIVIASTGLTKQTIYVVGYYIDYFTNLYKEILITPSIPFPNINDLSKHTPTSIVTMTQANEIIYKLMEKEVLNDRTLYGITFAKGVPTVMFPSMVSVNTLITAALKKLHELLKKGDTHDYFQKKISISNPGKEMGVKNFFKLFMENPTGALENLKDVTDNTFYYWSQMAYFIKQDYDKLKDFTPEDVNVLQSVYIIEIATSFYKTQAQTKQTKDNAFKNLNMLLGQPPYYFTMGDIVKFKDPHGVNLLGQYTEGDLKHYMEMKTTHTEGNNLPEVLTFKVGDGEGYFILKEKVMPLIIRLCSDARVTVRESLTKVWYKTLLEWETLPEMREAIAFENCLKHETAVAQPVLSALLNASFLPVLAIEDTTPGHIMLFRNDTLVPYSELLMISRQEIYTDARIKLPFWYTTPVISWIAALIFRKPKSKTKKQVRKSATEQYREEKLAEEKHEQAKRDAADTSDVARKARKLELRTAAEAAEKALVPANSSLNRELEGYEHEWNNMIGKTAHDNLTEDVNSLIRDYMRKVLRTLHASSFTPERISSLADSLVSTPSLMKIKNTPALKRYTELFMIKLVKNIP